MWKNRRAQSTVEYAVLAVVAVAVVLVMQIYMKRGLSGKLRDSTDRIGEQFTPHTAIYTLTKGRTGTRTETTTAPGALTSTVSVGTPESQTRTGTENPVDTDMATEKLFN